MTMRRIADTDTAKTMESVGQKSRPDQFEEKCDERCSTRNDLASENVPLRSLIVAADGLSALLGRQGIPHFGIVIIIPEPVSQETPPGLLPGRNWGAA